MDAVPILQFNIGAEPWIPFNAMEYLDGILKPWMTVFEWGSGGSTVCFAMRTQRVLSVEHDADWASEVGRELKKRDIENCTIFLIPFDEGAMKQDISSPTAYYENEYRDCNFLDYASFIDGESDGSIDLVFVDGQARPSCIAHAVPKIRPGGWLILDNSDRDYYLKDVGKLLDSWTRLNFHGPGPRNPYEWSCAFWRKPR